MEVESTVERFRYNMSSAQHIRIIELMENIGKELKYGNSLNCEDKKALFDSFYSFRDVLYKAYGMENFVFLDRMEVTHLSLPKASTDLNKLLAIDYKPTVDNNNGSVVSTDYIKDFDIIEALVEEVCNEELENFIINLINEEVTAQFKEKHVKNLQVKFQF